MKFLLLLQFSFLLCISTSAQDYYVSNSGSNANSGAISSPWLTIQYAVDQLSPSDILHIRAGTYNEKIELNVSGTTGNFITIQNYLAEAAIINGAGTTPTRNALIAIFDQNYIIIKGLFLTNNQENDAQGILVEGTSHHIEIRNNDISEINFSSNPAAPVDEFTNSQAIIVYGTSGTNAIHDLIIDGNNIYNCRLGYSEGLAVNGNIDGFEITNNTIHDITNIGIDAIGHEGTAPTAVDQARNGLLKNNTVYNCLSLYATSGGIYVDGGKNLIIENNTSYHNGYGIEIGCENNGTITSGITVRNNLIYNNQVAGLAMGGFNYPTSGKVINSTFQNNTLFQNDYSNSGNGEMYLSYCENCVLEQNIFYPNAMNKGMSYEPISAGSSFALDYNIFYTSSGGLEVNWNGISYANFSTYQSGTSQDANSNFIDPQLVNASLPTPNLHLNNGSPAINAGNPAFSAAVGEVDIDGDSRIVYARVDIGADESTAPLAVRYLEPLSLRLIDKKVKLSWTTASEENNNYFSIERSQNATHWSIIGNIQAMGEGGHYSVYDKNLPDGIVYYRLKQVDFDASFNYSNIVSIYVNSNKVNIEIYPNPANVVINIKELSGQPIQFISIYNQHGQLCLEKRKTSQQIDISTLRAGIYFIKMEIGGNVIMEKLIVE